MKRMDKAYVLQQAKEHDVKFIRLWFTDVLGCLKSMAITAEELEAALEDGVGFDGSSIEGFARVNENDMLAMPDPATFQILPWRPRENAVARMFCDILLPNGKPFEGDPRYVLKQNLKRAKAIGFTFYVGPEIEFFYFKTVEGREVLDQGSYFDQTPLDMATELRRETVLTLEEMGIGVETSHHEVAPSQHEIELRYTDALTMADNVMTFRLVVKEIAMKHGLYATFMPKPIYGRPGSGMHTHQSLFRREKNAFFDPRDHSRLSKIGKSYIAGLLRHAAEITLICNQWVNSYKRMVPGYEAPVYVAWGETNNSVLVRVPIYRPGKEIARRAELRSPDPACNPYLAFSVMLAAGLEGIKKGHPLSPPVEENLFDQSAQELEQMGIQRLPASLDEAIRYTESSKVVRLALGGHVFQTLIANKKIEWDRYRSQVTNYELKEYLPLL